jgi:tight adherence protein B
VTGLLACAGVVCAGAAGWLADPERLPSPAGWSRRVRRLVVAGAAVAGGVAGLAVGLLPRYLVPAAVFCGLAVVATRRVRAARAARQAAANREQDVRTLRALAAELRGGLSPVEAMRAVVQDAGAWLPPRPASGPTVLAALGPAAATEALGGDPAPVLARAQECGPALAAAWTVSRRTGAALAAPVRRIADAAAADLQVAREVEASLASARSSAQLLALLPLAGAALGALSGAGTLRVLLGTGLGQACLLLGVLLDLAGLAWLDRLAARAAR